MSDEFRELLKKVGSGSHTSKDLSRSEAAAATGMMLQQQATPAQIGAFMIAHRIKRPTGVELAGMLDAYDQLGPKLYPCEDHSHCPVVFGVPYDGRVRTAPVTVITALLLVTVGVPAILHGGRRMPTKYGIPLIESCQGLGLNLTDLNLSQMQRLFNQTGLGFIYLPQHFPEAEQLVTYREQIGKRPPFATLELMWCPYRGQARVISGYVHPPTEGFIQEVFDLHGISTFTTVKGLEGSCDLPRERTAIIGIHQTGGECERLLLSPRDYGFGEGNPGFESDQELISQSQEVLQGKESELMNSAIWNGGFYLWHSGACGSLVEGFDWAEDLLKTGKVMEKLAEIGRVLATDIRGSIFSNF